MSSNFIVAAIRKRPRPPFVPSDLWRARRDITEVEENEEVDGHLDLPNSPPDAVLALNRGGRG
jgi:hypothetical protein